VGPQIFEAFSGQDKNLLQTDMTTK